MKKMETKQKNPVFDIESATSDITHGGAKNDTYVQTEKRDSSYSWQHFSVICSVEIVVKIKAIAHNEGFSIRDVVEKFLSDGIARYEQRHGAVTNCKKNIDDIL